MPDDIVFSLYTANTGYFPRKAARLRAVKPLKQSVMTLNRHQCSRTYSLFSKECNICIFRSQRIWISFSSIYPFQPVQQSAIVLTASTGYFPYAVSPLSTSARLYDNRLHLQYL